MSEPRKKELVDEAEELGIDPAGKNKADLADEIEARGTPEVGAPLEAKFEQVGNVTGVQPLTADEIPEAGR